MTERAAVVDRAVATLLDSLDSLPTVDELLARAEITDTLKRYVRGIDRSDRDLLLSIYHPDAIDDHGMFVGSAVDFVEWALSRSGHFQAITHHIADPLIRIDGDRAFVESTGLAGHMTRPDADGSYSIFYLGCRYVDLFERRDGRWLIACRRVLYDWQYNMHCTVGDVAVPLDVLTGRQGTGDPWYGLLAGYLAARHPSRA